jgi:hypothetical protein
MHVFDQNCMILYITNFIKDYQILHNSFDSLGPIICHHNVLFSFFKKNYCIMKIYIWRWNRRDHVKRKLLTNLQVNVVKKKLCNNTPINAIVNTVSNISYRQLLDAYVTGWCYWPMFLQFFLWTSLRIWPML